MEFSQVSFIGAIPVIVLVYVLGLAIYRLYLSPIANIPGPKLAALTQWYETYYELFKPPTVGQFMFHYRELHEKYGPIIRISPREVHIQDSQFFNELYSLKRPWDKPKYLQHRFGNDEGLFPTPSHEVHRHRRAAMNPFFSKKAIQDYSPLIQARMDRLCDRLNREFKGTGKVVRLDWMFGCFSADTVISYCFDSEYNWIETPDLRCGFVDAMNELLNNVHLVTQFPLVAKMLNAIPKDFLAKLMPELKVVNDFDQAMVRQIAHTLENREAELKNPGQRTVFKALLESHLPPEELSPKRLHNEALTVIGAGLESTRWTLSVGSFHILNTPRIFQRLRKELEDAIPNPNNMLPLDKLEQLPYLDACVQESLRLSYGISQRAHRVSDHLTLQYGSYVIPPGFTVSMDNYAVAHDEQIFPDSNTFAPERWLDNARAPDDKPLTAYMVSFGRGTRQCVGKPLAMAQLYIVMANLYRKFDLKLYDTDRTAVDIAFDVFAPRPKPGTQGVRAIVN